MRTFGDNRDIGDPVRDPAIACQAEPAHDEITHQHVNVSTVPSFADKNACQPNDMTCALYVSFL